ncbi:unnamed protein product [Pleuronectes platessa]|uniref:Uncharacterized protein n=1 Tax=Pleuronectes platessa TaxID=8262 RepID=A0A9N7TJW6_PLEPL|nr:unnamed protein product [Pleuronectes platessa]
MHSADTPYFLWRRCKFVLTFTAWPASVKSAEKQKGHSHLHPAPPPFPSSGVTPDPTIPLKLNPCFCVEAMRASSVLTTLWISLGKGPERRMLDKAEIHYGNTSHSLHGTVETLSSSFSSRLLHPQCKEDTQHNCFLAGSSDFLESSYRKLGLLRKATGRLTACECVGTAKGLTAAPAAR